MKPDHHHIADAIADAARYELARKVAQIRETMNRSMGQYLRRTRKQSQKASA